MKKNFSLLIGIVAFVTLFYKQEVAVNLSIFGLLVWLLIYNAVGRKYHNKSFWALSLLLFFAIGSFAWFGDFASFVALFFTLTLFVVKAFYPKLNILAFPFVLIISGATSVLRVLYLKNWIVLPKTATTDFWKKVMAYLIVPILFTTVFLILYSFSSTKFASLFKFSWDLENIGIIAFLSVLGSFFMFNFLYVYVPRFLMKENFRLEDDFSRRVVNQVNNDKQFFRRSGEITLTLLNIIIAFFIFVYASESLQNLTPTESYSSEVHERVYVLMASIVVAVAIIMIYFYSPKNFDSRGKLLRTLSYIWIGLNALLAVVAILQTGKYVYHYGLTLKRVGVYVFLAMCLAGLLVTSFKLLFIKSNIYLLNRMFWICFITLVVGFNINWSWIVTKYNITNQAKPDIYYLSSLEFNKAILFNTYGDNPTGAEFKAGINEEVDSQLQKPFLSRNLYYQFLNLE